MGTAGVVTIGIAKSGVISTNVITGGSGDDSGEIMAGLAKNIVVHGSIVGGSAVSNSGYIQADNITTLNIGGNVTSGSGGVNSGGIRAVEDIGALSILGSVVGASGHEFIISAGGMDGLDSQTTPDIAIKTVTVGTNFTFGEILAGYQPPVAGGDSRGIPYNADAQIGTITVKMAVMESDFVAGAVPGAVGGDFGTLGDAKISGTGTVDRSLLTSRIASVIIGSAPAAPSGTYGIVSEEVTSVKVGGVAVALHTNPDNDFSPELGPGSKFYVHEV